MGTADGASLVRAVGRIEDAVTGVSSLYPNLVSLDWDSVVVGSDVAGRIA